MWRAWGIAFLFLSPQDPLGPRSTAPEHDLSFQPPIGWVRILQPGPAFVRFIQPGGLVKPAEFLVTHLHSSLPTPLESFKKQARDFVKEKYPDAKTIDDRELVLGDRPAFRLVFSHEKGIELKTIVHRSNLEYYLLDATFPLEKSEATRALIESVIATLHIEREPLSNEQQAQLGRALHVIRGAKIDPALLGERWYGIYTGKTKVGHFHARLFESEGLYGFEVQLQTDFGEGSKETTNTRGSFSPDGRVQKLETEQSKASAKDKWQFRSSVTIQNGQAKSARDLNGVKEDKNYPVEEGALLSDIAELMRPVLIGAGKGIYLVKTMSPFCENWNFESLEVGDVENLEIEGKDRDLMLVQVYQPRRKNLTFFYHPDRRLFRMGGPRDSLSVRESNKEDALK